MKKIVIALLMVMGLVSCAEQFERPALSAGFLDLSPLNKVIYVNQEYQMPVKVTPADAPLKEIIWSSSNEKVATVSETGLVKGIALGETVITAVMDNITARCKIMVENCPAQKVELNVYEQILEKGATFELTASVLPDETTDKTVVWKSSDPSIVSVENGKITANAEGGAVITASCGTVSATCNVIILGEEPVMLPSSVELDKDESIEIKVYLPENLKNETIVWESADPEMVTVTAASGNPCAGVITALGFGETEVTATVGTHKMVCAVVVPNVAMLNLDEIKAEELLAELQKYKDAGVQTLKISGDFGKLGIKAGNDVKSAKNPFRTLCFNTLDFTGITPSTWPKIKVNVLINKAATDCEIPGLPAYSFARGISGKATDIDESLFVGLETVILPEDVKAAGDYAFGASTIKTLVAPDLHYLGQRWMIATMDLRHLHLKTKDVFYLNELAFKGTKSVSNVTLHLDPSKTSEAGDNKSYLETPAEWKSIVFE